MENRRPAWYDDGVVLHRREWGTGQPLIAMHPLGLDSSAFEGVGRELAPLGFRTIAVDLPGFGQTPLPDDALTPAAMAAPVIELARELDQPPIVIGVSMGGRVALEVALSAPTDVRAVVAIAPYLPWRRFQPFMQTARMIDPRVADWMRFELAWPVLRLVSQGLEKVPWLRDDPMAQAGMRFVYYLSCPATRAGFIRAAREMALDPAHGPEGLWERLQGLQVPGVFLWGERDQIVSLDFSRAVARWCPQAEQLLLPCVGHWLNGPHHRCFASALARLASRLVREERDDRTTRHSLGVDFLERPCVLDDATDIAPAPAAAAPVAIAERWP